MSERRALVCGEQIDFVEDLDAGLGGDRARRELFRLETLLFAVGGGGVADMKQKFGLGYLFERGAKTGDERVGRLRMKPTVSDEERGGDWAARWRAIWGRVWRTCATTREHARR